jgi:hypothetical protein
MEVAAIGLGSTIAHDGRALEDLDRARLRVDLAFVLGV